VNQAWRINLTFTPDAAPKFDAAAAQVLGRQLAVVVDGRVLSAPSMMSSHFNGQAQITGTFTKDEAEALAAALAVPPLPVKVSTVKCSGAACGSSSS
jgi:preprotein translocase subunit SecD